MGLVDWWGDWDWDWDWDWDDWDDWDDWTDDWSVDWSVDWWSVWVVLWSTQVLVVFRGGDLCGLCERLLRGSYVG